MSGKASSSLNTPKISSYGGALSRCGDALNNRYEMKRQTSSNTSSNLNSNRPAGLMRQTSLSSYTKKSGTSV